MRLFVCWGTWQSGDHPCGRAYTALKEAGHDPEVVRSYGWGAAPDALNITSGRRRAKELTGDTWVPVLELDDGTAVDGSDAIVDWAGAHRA